MKKAGIRKVAQNVVLADVLNSCMVRIIGIRTRYYKYATGFIPVRGGAEMRLYSFFDLKVRSIFIKTTASPAEISNAYCKGIKRIGFSQMSEDEPVHIIEPEKFDKLVKKHRERSAAWRLRIGDDIPKNFTCNLKRQRKAKIARDRKLLTCEYCNRLIERCLC